MSTVQWPDDSMFQHFSVLEETYKTVDSHEIKAAVLIPKKAKPGIHPVILNFHGGFLVYGGSLFAPFFGPWILKLALENDAVLVSADYRLLPSSNDVADVLEDIEDFWQWTRVSLPAVLDRRTPGHSVDYSRLLVTGGSAGGYCATQIGMSHPDDIAAMALVYPFVDPHDPLMFSGPAVGDPSIMRTPVEDLPPKEAVLNWIEDVRNTVASKAGWEKGPYAVAAAQYGIFYSKIFDNLGLDRTEHSPVKRLAAGAKLPQKVWILHGDDDSVVHIRATHKFLDLARDKSPDTTVRLDIAAGEDHGFENFKTSWELHAIGALDFVKQSWLRDRASPGQ